MKSLVQEIIVEVEASFAPDNRALACVAVAEFCHALVRCKTRGRIDEKLAELVTWGRRAEHILTPEDIETLQNADAEALAMFAEALENTADKFARGGFLVRGRWAFPDSSLGVASCDIYASLEFYTPELQARSKAHTDALAEPSAEGLAELAAYAATMEGAAE